MNVDTLELKEEGGDGEITLFVMKPGRSFQCHERSLGKETTASKKVLSSLRYIVLVFKLANKMATNQSVCQNLQHCYEIHPCNWKHPPPPTNQKDGGPTYTLENSPEIVTASIPNHHFVVVSLSCIHKMTVIIYPLLHGPKVSSSYGLIKVCEAHWLEPKLGGLFCCKGSCPYCPRCKMFFPLKSPLELMGAHWLKTTPRLILNPTKNMKNI